MAEQKEQPGTQLVNIEEQLKKQLAGLQNRVGAPPSNRISTKGKVFTLPDGQTGTELQVIILDWRHVLAHYPGVYNANNPQDPNCFAVGVNKPESGALVPHSSIAKPLADNCRDCPKNQWKSSPTGGKACKNQVRLMVVASTADGDAQPMTLYVSPGALKGFNAYVTELANFHGLDLIQVVTHISFDPNQTYPSLVFKMLDKHAKLNEMWALKNRYQEVVERPIELRHQQKAA